VTRTAQKLWPQITLGFAEKGSSRATKQVGRVSNRCVPWLIYDRRLSSDTSYTGCALEFTDG